MRLVLYSLCIFIVLLASALFILGYEGIQIREFLLVVAAMIAVASRMLKPQQDDNSPREKRGRNDTRRRNRLSVRDEAPADESESPDASDSTQIS